MAKTEDLPKRKSPAVRKAIKNAQRRAEEEAAAAAAANVAADNTPAVANTPAVSATEAAAIAPAVSATEAAATSSHPAAFVIPTTLEAPPQDQVSGSPFVTREGQGWQAIFDDALEAAKEQSRPTDIRPAAIMTELDVIFEHIRDASRKRERSPEQDDAPRKRQDTSPEL